MSLWLWALVVVPVVALLIPAAVLAWVWWTGRSVTAATADLKAAAADVVRLPWRLRRVAADPRTPRRARWMLIGLAIYVASPIDIIPDFLPGVGLLDEVVLVPVVLARIRRMIPPEVWAEHFPPREAP